MKKKKHKSGNATYDHVLKYTGLFGGVQVLKMLVSVIRNKLASRILGPAGMGFNAECMKAGELVNSISNLGLSFSAVRNISELYEKGTEEEISHYICVVRTWSLWSAVFAALLCMGGASLLNWMCFTDSSTSHTVDVLLLTLFVISLPIEAVECAILKGVRRLKYLSVVETFAAISSLLCTIPFYYLMGIRGVVLALIISSWVVVGCHLIFTTRLFKWRVKPFDTGILREGLGLIKLGIPYMFAGIFGALTAPLVFQMMGSDSEVGLYNAGYSLMVTYAGMVFVAIEADYFPRLSSANNDKVSMNHIINQQIDICILIMTPMLILMALLMPRIIHILFAHSFIAIAPMAVCAVFYMFFKAITLPVAYLPLAKGNSMLYLLMEVLYDAAYVLLIYVGYQWGAEHIHLKFDDVPSGALAGTGIGLTLAGLFDMVVICTTYSAYYGFRFSKRTLYLIGMEFVCLSVTVPFCVISGITLYKWSIGLVALLLSCVVAWRLLSRHSGFVTKIKRKLKHSDGCDCCK